MKKTIIALALLSLLSSCNSDNDTPPVNTPIEEIQEFNITLSGTLQTNTCDVTTNSYSVRAEYISDDNVIDSELWTGDVEQNVTDSVLTIGDVIGVKVRLTNFNAQDVESGRGTGIKNIQIKITDVNTNELLIDKKIQQSLLICTDVYYELVLLYNTQTGSFISDIETHAF